MATQVAPSPPPTLPTPPPPPAALSAPPAADQLVTHGGKTYTTVREGAAFILLPLEAAATGTAAAPDQRTGDDAASDKPPSNGAGADAAAPKKTRKGKSQAQKADDAAARPQSVFYNPIQQFNRDLSVLAIRAFGEDLLRRKRARNERGRERKGRRAERRRANAEVGKVGEGDSAGAGAGKKRAIEDVGQGGGEARESPEKKVKMAEVHVEHLVGQNDTLANSDAVGTGSEGGAQGGVQGASVLDAADKGGEHVAEQQQRQTPLPPEEKKQPRFRILDALSATGLRALRYAHEIPFVTAVMANDMSSSAIKSMGLNIEHNGLGSKITTNVGDAIGHMYSVAFPPGGSHPNNASQKYDVIDLDPYGTAAPFIDAALQALNDGGMLCVTCTDSGVFASTGYSEKTFALYGGMPVKGPHMHEGGLRLIINSVASAAAKHGLAVEPLLSLSIDYYVRIFIRVRKSPFDVKFLAGKTMLVYGCDAGCGAWTTQPLARNVRQWGKDGHLWFKHSIAQAPTADRLCEHCGSKTHVAGPMWAGPLHSQVFVEKILHDVQSADAETYQTIPRIEGMLATALDELSVNAAATQYNADKVERDESVEMIAPVPSEVVDCHPFFFNPSAVSKVLHCMAPPDAAIKGALRRAGYRAVRSHCQPGSIKTNAPWTAIWEIMREWVRQKSPIKAGALKEGQAGWKIMQAARPQADASEASAQHDAAASNGNNRDESPDIIIADGKSSDDTELRADGEKRLEVIFDEVMGKDAPGKRLLRYQQNPRENWGPMSRARGKA